MRYPSLAPVSTGDSFRARQALDVGGRQSQVPREQVGGVLSQGGRPRAGGGGAIERGRHAGGEIVSDTGLVQPREEWISSLFGAFRDIREGAVPLKQHGGVR